MQTKEEKLLREAIGIIDKAGSIKYAQDYAKRILEDSWSSLEKQIPEGQAKQDLYELSHFLIKRDL